jgi:hypothetical protein
MFRPYCRYRLHDSLIPDESALRETGLWKMHEPNCVDAQEDRPRTGDSPRFWVLAWRCWHEEPDGPTGSLGTGSNSMHDPFAKLLRSNQRRELVLRPAPGVWTTIMFEICTLGSLQKGNLKMMNQHGIGTKTDRGTRAKIGIRCPSV